MKFLVPLQREDMIVGLDESGKPCMYKVGAQSIAASPQYRFATQEEQDVLDASIHKKSTLNL